MSAYKKFDVTVELRTYDNRVYNTQHFLIKAKDEDEADAIVHNKMVLSHEPRFKIINVKEAESGD
ncbi:hypothetical protein SAMN04487864_11550 [Succiniclasticum ruminis]|uniref:Uncharacterized protein n=1 Tax=Succiniclasticum ruminis TaxID=40841 RepID=A0A1G6NS27_9FIRM|nr:hypothetical protein [Succiniclasticum ruminis]SDC70116.1 hypothetical protein SAMN04487864_11550 [Succiniclasticum ruminis]